MDETFSERTSRVKIIPANQKNVWHTDLGEEQKKRVAAYCRVSTQDETQAGSYQLQVDYYQDFISNNSAWIYKGVYADDGITGTSTVNREAFNRMIKDCYDGKIDYIITKSISRFARNTLDCLKFIRELKNLPKPVGVYFEKENIDTLDNKSELFLTILSSMAQEESRSISENTRWGLKKRFQREQGFVPTTYFLGYDTDPEGNIVIDDEQAKVVRRIFNDCLSGMGGGEIAKGLMKDGILTARGNTLWRSDAVLKILKNEKYIGDVLTSKTVTVDFLTHKRVRNQGHEDQYYIRNHHPAIITQEQFYAVQEELKRRYKLLRDPDQKYRTTHSNRAPFSNKFICGICERPAIRRRFTTTRNREKHIYTAWQCRVASGSDRELKSCKGRYVYEVGIEKTFIKLLYELKGEEDKLLEESLDVIKARALNDEQQKRMAHIETQLDTVQKRMADLTDNVDGAHGEIYQSTIRHLHFEKEALNQELDYFKQKLEASQHLAKQFQLLRHYLDDLPEEGMAPDDFNADIFLHLVERGILYPDYQIHFQLKCGLERTIEGYKK